MPPSRGPFLCVKEEKEKRKGGERRRRGGEEGGRDGVTGVDILEMSDVVCAEVRHVRACRRPFFTKFSIRPMRTERQKDGKTITLYISAMYVRFGARIVKNELYTSKNADCNCKHAQENNDTSIARLIIVLLKIAKSELGYDMIEGALFMHQRFGYNVAPQPSETAGWLFAASYHQEA